MDALDLALVGLIAILATAFALVLLARLSDFKTLRRLDAELDAAWLRIAELQTGQGPARREPEPEPEPAGRFSRR